MKTKAKLKKIWAENRRLLRQAWKKLGRDPAYPITTREALVLLQCLGYDATRQRLDYYLSAEYLAMPKQQLGRYAWDEDSILAFASALEERRAWLQLSRRHWNKKTHEEISCEIESHGEELYQFAELQKLPLFERFALVRECSEKELRGTIIATIIGSIESEHGIQISPEVGVDAPHRGANHGKREKGENAAR